MNSEKVTVSKDFVADGKAAGIISKLKENGYEAYLCGGCVRDWLMGRQPKDFDITTSATPDEVESLFEKTIPVGKAFGVMIVVVDEENFEVATFRSDGAYVDGRRPEGVVFTSACEDVRRRDFTINALLYDMEAKQVIDYVGGVADIENRMLRTVGDPHKRFMEDHLRLLRAVRFAARTGFELEENTLAAMKELAGLSRTVSGERTGKELERMLSEGYAADALELLQRSGLLIHVLPEVTQMIGMPQPPQFHPEGDVYTHTLIMLQMMDKREGESCPETSFEKEVLGWAVLLHDIGKPVTLTVSDRIRFNRHDREGKTLAEEVLERLKRPRRLIDVVADMIGRHMHFATLKKMRVAKLRRFLQEPMFKLHLELHRLDCMSSHGMIDNYEFGLEKWKEEKLLPPEVKPLLGGKDLIDLGYAPGPQMGRILEAMEDARLENLISDKDQAIHWVKEQFPV